MIRITGFCGILQHFKGRFSNGYTFADLVANKAVGLVTKPVFPYDFEDPWLGIPIAPFESDPSGKSLNFAYGGARIEQGEEVVPDLDGQTDAFRDAVGILERYASGDLSQDARRLPGTRAFLHEAMDALTGGLGEGLRQSFCQLHHLIGQVSVLASEQNGRVFQGGPDVAPMRIEPIFEWMLYNSEPVCLLGQLGRAFHLLQSVLQIIPLANL